jgi:hypothetical protein
MTTTMRKATTTTTTTVPPNRRREQLLVGWKRGATKRWGEVMVMTRTTGMGKRQQQQQ